MSDFVKWFKEQSHREDSVGWVAKWFLHKRQGRFPKKPELFPTCDHWLKVIEDRAAKAQKIAARGAFLTAWEEFHDGPRFDKDVMYVRPTIARLEMVVKGSQERGTLKGEKVLAVSKFHGPVANVGVEERMTTSHGGDWVRLGVSVSIPCYPEEIGDAYRFGEKWVTEKVWEEIEKFRGGAPRQPESDGEIEEVNRADTILAEPVDEPESEPEPEPEENSDEPQDFGI